MLEVYKIQRPIATNSFDFEYMIYNEDKSNTMFSDAPEISELFRWDQYKIFVYGYVKDTIFYVDGPMEESQCPDW